MGWGQKGEVGQRDFIKETNMISKQVPRKERVWISIFFTCFRSDRAEGTDERFAKIW